MHLGCSQFLCQNQMKRHNNWSTESIFIEFQSNYHISFLYQVFESEPITSVKFLKEHRIVHQILHIKLPFLVELMVSNFRLPIVISSTEEYLN